MGRPTVLWADDETQHWKGLLGFLHDETALITARNYQEAWERSEGIDAAIIDLVMPYAIDEPSVDQYIGLTLAKNLLSQRKRLCCLVVFTCVVDPAVSRPLEDLRELCAERKVTYIYRSKGNPEGFKNFVNGILANCRPGDQEKGS